MKESFKYILILGIVLAVLPSAFAELTIDNYFECLAGESDCSNEDYQSAKDGALFFVIVAFIIFLRLVGFI
jgi:hypothetical protein